MSETNPLLPRRISSGSRPSFSLGARTRTLSNAQVHPDPLHVEPLLPASAPHPDQQTRLHQTKWTNSQLIKGEPNTWAKLRHLWREELAEFWGSFMILLFGAGVECQVNLNPGVLGDYLQGRMAWAAGVAIAVWVSGGISGGHCNPTVTICLALFRGFPKRKIPSFIIAQVLGCTAASLVVYANYCHSIERFEGGSTRTVTGPHATAPLFFTFPAPFLPWKAAFFSEFLGAATLIAIVFALGDKANLAPPKGTQPFAMFIVLLAIGASLGANTGYAMNGARDTGPRIALWLMGYGSEVFTNNRFYFIWAPWVAAIAGGLLGASVYDAFMYTGRDSPFNRPARASRGDTEAVFEEDEE